MKSIAIAVVVAAVSLTSAPAEASHKPKHKHCKVLSVVTTERPGGVQYNDDGTSETLTKYTVTTKSRCRGKIVITKYSYIGY